MRLPSWLAQHLAALRVLAVLTIVFGLAYPLVVTAAAQVPGLKDKADGSYVSIDGKQVGSSLIGQAFTDKDGNPLKQYFQSRPSAAGDGYDMTSTSASNLGPESILDTLPDPKIVAAGKTDDNAKSSLLSTVCARSVAVGQLEGVDGSRPFCTSGGVGAVLSVIGLRNAQGNVEHPTKVVSVNEEAGVVSKPFISTYKGVTVELAQYGQDYSAGQIVPIRGSAPASPKVPADAVAASASGLDPDISPAYAELQAARVAKTRGITVDQVKKAIKDNESGRTLGFMGQPRVNVLKLNLELDDKYPYQG